MGGIVDQVVNSLNDEPEKWRARKWPYSGIEHEDTGVVLEDDICLVLDVPGRPIIFPLFVKAIRLKLALRRWKWAALTTPSESPNV